VIRYLTLLVFILIGSFAYAQEDDGVIRSDTSVSSSGTMDTTVRSPPPSAISPQLGVGSGDLCTIGVSGAVQTQILGISMGKVYTEENCLRLKNAKTMYDMGMKVAAVSVMCQDEKVFDAMMNAGTPCPKDGLIGNAAKLAWEMEANTPPTQIGKGKAKGLMNVDDETKLGVGAVLGVLLLLVLL
jgi:hypothetical protein